MKNKADESELLKKVLDRLLSLDPPVRKVAVSAADVEMNVYFVDLADVCYITTDKAAESQRDETAFVTAKNEIFFNNQSLKEIEDMLAEDPHFMRTSKSYIVNLAKIRALKFSNARDLWFDGLEKPVKNIVTATYVAAFELRMKGKSVPPPAPKPPQTPSSSSQSGASKKRKKQ